MKSKLLGVSVLAFLPCSPLGAANWELATGSDNGLMVYIDTQSVKRTGSRVKVWERWTYDSPQTSNGNSFQSARLLHIYDCANRTSAMMREVLYSEVDGGNVVKSTFHTEAIASPKPTPLLGAA